MDAFTIICGLNYPFELGRQYRVPIRFGLFWLGAFVMVYPGQTVQITGAAVFTLIFLTEEVVTKGSHSPLGAGAG
ncbi:hypothetical protein [Halobiforma nitratireducens]|uniref:TRAP transporter, 4TM/12TM fusion protein n=1 Tax=Halobiforma nitratireducens JCM 10879 TaxID=1227454 RepID=M0LTF1_9EURY|nr:hypothetical protein [Halobiforma nitratireducens]EMA35385.1 TRAP transporter, 4TM/12TM fusion protein [Halobiforma nitratireducens JCM 10879]